MDVFYSFCIGNQHIYLVNDRLRKVDADVRDLHENKWKYCEEEQKN